MNNYSFGPVEKISGAWGWFRGFESEAPKFVAYGYISTKKEAVERRNADITALKNDGHNVVETGSVTDVDFKFSRSDKNFDHYGVTVGDKYLGSVIKRTQWTVRGDKVWWEGRAGGIYVGSGDTRKEAAKALVNR